MNRLYWTLLLRRRVAFLTDGTPIGLTLVEVKLACTVNGLMRRVLFPRGSR